MDHNHHHHHQQQPQQPQSWSPLDFSRHNDIQSHDYPSPASPSYPLNYAQQQEFHDPSSSTPNDPQFTQIQPSIGPDRVLTRKQRAAITQQQQQNGGHRRFSGLSSQSSQDSRQATSGMYFNMMMPAPSRPQTPSARPATIDPHEANAPTGSSTGPASFSEREHLSLSIGATTSLSNPMRSPQFPLTPASTSASAGSSGFGSRNNSHLFPAQHSRSNSSSGSTNPRSASPALSVASALTSVSSSASAPPSSASALRLNPSLQDNSGLGSPIASLAGSNLPHTFPSLPPPRAKQRKQRLFNVDRKAICQYHKDNPNARQEDIAARYGVERSTISKILKHKTKWLNVGEGDGLKVAKHRPSKFPLIELSLVDWLVEATANNQSLSDAMIRSKAKDIARNLEIGEDKFKASSGWVENFKHRNNIKGGKWLGIAKTFIGNGYQLRKATPVDGEDDDSGGDIENGISLTNHSRHDDHSTVPSSLLHSSGPSLSLQPAWPTPVEHQSHSASVDLDGAYHHRHHHMDHQQEHHHDQQPQEDIHMHPPAIDPQLQHPSQHDPPAVAIPVLIQDTPGMYIQTHSGQEIYHQEGPRLPRAPHQPTIADAEEAMNTVLAFLDSTGKGLIKPDDREALYNVKCALFQAASGVTFSGSS